MKYLELYIHSLIEKRAQNTVPANRTSLSLPGLKTAKQLDLEQIKRYKKEYTRCLRDYQRDNAAKNSLSKKKKAELKKKLDATKQHLAELLRKIGSHTQSEKTHGFSEADYAQ